MAVASPFCWLKDSTNSNNVNKDDTTTASDAPPKNSQENDINLSQDENIKVSCDEINETTIMSNEIKISTKNGMQTNSFLHFFLETNFSIYIFIS